MGSFGEVGRKEMVPCPPEAVILELRRLEDHVREKERELGAAYCEIKAMKVTEFLKDKAAVELGNELKKLDYKLRNAEKHLEDKNLEIKKLIIEKKDALTAQFAAEATLRRVYATQKDKESISVEAIIAPYESDIRMYKNKIATLHEDNKALEHLIKSKEAALVEAERILHDAQERALMMENLQNENIQFKRQIEICKEENRLLEKTNRQKVVEVEKLSQSICELEESILAGGAVANAARNYQRQVFELNEDKRTLERELARVKVSVNRVAMVVANEWKDDSDKVISIKQWLEERKYLHGEIQRLRDKLTIAERTAKAEAQIKDKVKLRLKTLEEGLRVAASFSNKQPESSHQIFGSSPANGGSRKRSTSQPRASFDTNKASGLQQPNSASEDVGSTRKIVRTDSLKTKFVTGDNLVRRNLWAPRRKFSDDSEKENTDRKANSNGHVYVISIPGKENPISENIKANGHGDVKSQNNDVQEVREDIISGFLYDRLQKEVINLRKMQEEKDGVLHSKDDEIKLLQRKVDALTKAMEVESKRMRREVAAKEKELLLKSEDNKQKLKATNSFKRPVKHQESSADLKNLRQY